MLVGGNKASAQYVRMKEQYAESLGLETVSCVLEETATTEQVVEKIKEILGRTPNFTELSICVV